LPWQVAWEWPSERMSVGEALPLEARLVGAWEALPLEARSSEARSSEARAWEHRALEGVNESEVRVAGALPWLQVVVP
jgi:hypothetical protein